MTSNPIYAPDSMLCGWCGQPATCMGLWSKACARCCAVHHTRKSGEKTCDRKAGK